MDAKMETERQKCCAGTWPWAARKHSCEGGKVVGKPVQTRRALHHQQKEYVQRQPQTRTFSNARQLGVSSKWQQLSHSFPFPDGF